MGVSVIYSTDALLHKNKGEVGKHSEPIPFASVKAAKAAPVPEAYAFAVIRDETGTACDVYSKRLGWRPCNEQ
jgi:hypothetical protein